MLKNIKSYMNYVKTVRELETLSDRELTDLGIARFDIKRLAKNHSRGD